MRALAEFCILFLLALYMAAGAHGADRPVHVGVMVAYGEDRLSTAATVAYGETKAICEEQAQAFIAKHGPTDYVCEPIPYSEFEKIADWLQYLEGQGKTVIYTKEKP